MAVALKRRPDRLCHLLWALAIGPAVDAIADETGPVVVLVPAGIRAELVDALRLELGARSVAADVVPEGGEPAGAAPARIVVRVTGANGGIEARTEGDARSVVLPFSLDDVDPRVFALAVASLLDPAPPEPDRPPPPAPAAAHDRPTRRHAAGPSGHAARPPTRGGPPGVALGLAFGIAATHTPLGQAAGDLSVDLAFGWHVTRNLRLEGGCRLSALTFLPKAGTAFAALVLAGPAVSLPTALGELDIGIQGVAAGMDGAAGLGGAAHVGLSWHATKSLTVGPRMQGLLWDALEVGNLGRERLGSSVGIALAARFEPGGRDR